MIMVNHEMQCSNTPLEKILCTPLYGFIHNHINISAKLQNHNIWFINHNVIQIFLKM